jgi:hypothetical protein
MERKRDKRLFPRRPTAPVPVLLCHKAEPAREFPGEVLDYSPAGLSIQVREAVPANAVLLLRCVREGEDATRLEVHVTQCAARGDGWRLGCRFDRPQHWDDLHMFAD